MNDDDEILQKIERMSHDEVVGYLKAAKFIDKLVSVFAVVIIFLALLFPSTILLIATTITVYLLANVSVAVAEFINYLHPIIKKKSGR